jgi:hypothetical protein
MTGVEITILRPHQFALMRFGVNRLRERADGAVSSHHQNGQANLGRQGISNGGDDQDSGD